MTADTTRVTGTNRRLRLRTALVRHHVFLLLLAIGFVLRVITQIAYRPALLFIDSFRYLANLHLDPGRAQPIGYSSVLRALLWVFGNLSSIAALQHALGLAMAVAIYAVAVRRGVRRWLAAAAAAPVLLSAYQLQIEQNLLSEAWFEALTLAAVVLLIWNPRPRLPAVAAAGLLLGLAVSVRVVGLLVVVPAMAYVLVTGPSDLRRYGRTIVLVILFAAPLLAYGGYSQARNHRFQLTTSDASVIAARAETIVDCRGLDLPQYERTLCPSEPLGQRKGIDEYAHDAGQPQQRFRAPPGMNADDVRRDFAVRVIKHQPLDFAGAVLRDFVKVFAWSPTTAHNDVSIRRWQFQNSYPVFPGHSPDPAPTIHRYGGGGPAIIRPLATALRRYQLSIGFVPGPLLAAAVVVALVAGAGVGRARRSGLRAACMLPTLCGLTLVLAADVFEFSWRYQLPLVLLAPLGGALGLTALLPAPAADLAPREEAEVGEPAPRAVGR